MLQEDAANIEFELLSHRCWFLICGPDIVVRGLGT
jgi:hypothetical protein